MIVKDVIQGDLNEWFSLITSTPGNVIPWISQDPQPLGDVITPRPTGLYGAINIINMTRTGITDYKELVNEALPGVDLTEDISGLRRLQISINTYRQGAFNLMSLLNTALQRTSTIEYLTSRGLGYGDTSDIRDLSALVGSSLEERYQMDVFIFTAATDSEIVYAIQSVNINGVVDNGTQQTTIEIEVDDQ